MKEHKVDLKRARSDNDDESGGGGGYQGGGGGGDRRDCKRSRYQDCNFNEKRDTKVFEERKAINRLK